RPTGPIRIRWTLVPQLRGNHRCRGLAVHVSRCGPIDRRRYHVTTGREDLLNSVLDCTVDGVLMTDDDGVIVYVNSSLMRLFGYTGDEDSPVGMPIGGFLHAADEMDVEGGRSDGSMFAVDVQVRVLPDAPFVVATVRDMTAQRHAV